MKFTQNFENLDKLMMNTSKHQLLSNFFRKLSESQNMLAHLMDDKKL